MWNYAKNISGPEACQIKPNPKFCARPDFQVLTAVFKKVNRVICFWISCIHSWVFTSREIFALFFIYYVATDNSSVNLCSKYSTLDQLFLRAVKLFSILFGFCSFVRGLFAFCSRFVPRRGPQGGLPYMYMYTTTHEVFSFAYFSVYNEQHTTIIMQLGTL